MSKISRLYVETNLLMETFINMTIVQMKNLDRLIKKNTFKHGICFKALDQYACENRPNA